MFSNTKEFHLLILNYHHDFGVTHDECDNDIHYTVIDLNELTHNYDTENMY